MTSAQINNTRQLESESCQKIAFIGCGNMATAIIGGLVSSGWPCENIIVSNPSKAKLDALQSRYPVKITIDNNEATRFSDILVLSVKPQKLTEVCALIANNDLTDKLVISIAAGYNTAKIEEALKQKPPLIRSMPNTPSLIGQGASGLYATPRVTEQQKIIASKIFDSFGVSTWISEEQHMDIVTAISGSSPAYIFLLMQAMVEQAVTSGLAQKDAFSLITQAVSGAAQLAQECADKPLEQLRKEVTSPGGTTEAAINSFNNNQFSNIVKQAVIASIERGKLLAEK